MAPEFDPQNEVQKWHPKRRPNTLNKALISFRFLLNQNIGHPFWMPFFDPILGGSNSGAIFGSIFQPHFGVQNMVQNLQKFLLPKLHGKPFSGKHASQNASVVIAQLVTSLNTILYLAKPSKKTKVLIATNVAHEQDGLEPQNLILWRSLHAALVFHMKNDPVLGGHQS